MQIIVVFCIFNVIFYISVGGSVGIGRERRNTAAVFQLKLILGDDETQRF